MAGPSPSWPNRGSWLGMAHLRRHQLQPPAREISRKDVAGDAFPVRRDVARNLSTATARQRWAASIRFSGLLPSFSPPPRRLHLSAIPNLFPHWRALL